MPVDLPEDEVLARLVAMNKERATGEAKGFVRSLRPECQIPRFGSDAEKKQRKADFGDQDQKPAAEAKVIKPDFPTDAVDQVAAVMAALAPYDVNVPAAKLASLSRRGFIATTKDSTAFAIRRAG
jgi:hypothetical protein